MGYIYGHINAGESILWWTQSNLVWRCLNDNVFQIQNIFTWHGRIECAAWVQLNKTWETLEQNKENKQLQKNTMGRFCLNGFRAVTDWIIQRCWTTKNTNQTSNFFFTHFEHIPKTHHIGLTFFDCNLMAIYNIQYTTHHFYVTFFISFWAVLVKF